MRELIGTEKTAARLYERANAAVRDAVALERWNPRFARVRRRDAKALRKLASAELRR